MLQRDRGRRLSEGKKQEVREETGGEGRNRRWLSKYLGSTLISVAIWAVFCKNSDISLKKKIVIRARR
jgi:hypothetical protein